MNKMAIKTIIFDLGNTLIEQIVDSEKPLDQINLKLLPGVKRALLRLSDKYKLGLLTNTVQSKRHNVYTALYKLSIVGYFDEILTSTDMGIEKPDPKIFIEILSRLHSKPEETLMVGNDYAQDIKGAHKLGIRTAFFTCFDSNYDYKDDIQPDIDFDSFDNLANLIQIMEKEDGKMDQNDRETGH